MKRLNFHILIFILSALPLISLAREDIWTRKADMPVPVRCLSANAVNGKIYAIGGGRSSQPYTTVEVYDPATDTWTTAADMPTARAELATCAVNGRIYAFGGGRMAGSLWIPLDEGVVEEYDTGMGVPWIQVAQISPQEGSTNGGTPIYIAGSNFQSGLNMRPYATGDGGHIGCCDCPAR